MVIVFGKHLEQDRIRSLDLLALPKVTDEG